MNKNKIFIKIALISLICFCIVTIFKLQISINDLKAEKDKLQEQISDYKVVVEEKQYYSTAELTDDFIIKIAREKFGLVFPGEIVFITENID